MHNGLSEDWKAFSDFKTMLCNVADWFSFRLAIFQPSQKIPKNPKEDLLIEAEIY